MPAQAKVIPGGIFHMSDDQTPAATNAEMAQLLGSNWQEMAFAQHGNKINELLKPYNQTFSYVPEAGWMRSNDHPIHTIAVWTSRRQTVKYILSTEPPKPKKPA